MAKRVTTRELLTKIEELQAQVERLQYADKLRETAGWHRSGGPNGRTVRLFDMSTPHLQALARILWRVDTSAARYKLASIREVLRFRGNPCPV